ncbi:MAG: hypothetical protein HKN43_00260 [Rhodothermales bacterium]|nr:hypothetical protein [Rhodothermales bacterium]
MTLAILALLLSPLSGVTDYDGLKDAQRYSYDKPSDAVKNMMAPPGWALKFALDHWDISKFYNQDGEGGEFGNDAMEWNLRFVLGISRIAQAQIRNRSVVWWASVLLAYQWVSFDPGRTFTGSKPSSSALQNIYLRAGGQTMITQAIMLTFILSFAWDLAPDDNSEGELPVSDLQNAIVSYLTFTYLASEVLRVFLIYECARRLAVNDFRLGALGNFGLGFRYQLLVTQSIILWAGLSMWYLREANYRFNGEKVDNTGGYLLTLGPALYLTMLDNRLSIALTGSRNEYGSRIGILGLIGKNFQRPAKDFALSFIYRI